jgi:hypothetical protein
MLDVVDSRDVKVGDIIIANVMPECSCPYDPKHIQQYISDVRIRCPEMLEKGVLLVLSVSSPKFGDVKYVVHSSFDMKTRNFFAGVNVLIYRL